MLIPVATIIEHLKSANIDIHGVLHVGAHECQEAEFYSSIGVSPEKTLWIDAIESKVDQAKARGIPNVYHAVITDKDNDTVNFNISNNEQSSSILELGTHTVEHPSIHYIKTVQEKTITLDTFFKNESINPDKYTLWNFDIQGAELLALKGAENALKYAKALYLEVNTSSLYKGCALLPELDSYLELRGFERVELKMTTHGWGDALYIRKSKPRVLMLILANDDGGLYSALQESWKRYMNSSPYIDAYFIKGRLEQTDEYSLEDNTLYIKTREGYANNDALFVKTILAFKYFMPVLDKYTFVFRTNLSSFIRFDKYLEICETLPHTELCMGLKLTAYGVDYPSGCGFTLSTDLVKRFVKEPPEHYVIDDVTIGTGLAKWGIPILNVNINAIQPADTYVNDTTSEDAFNRMLINPGDAFHYRIRTGWNGRLNRDTEMHRVLFNRFYRPRKVAICYWGLLRTFKQTYESHKKYIYDVIAKEGFEVDIFIHSWKPHTDSDIPKMPYKVFYNIEDQTPLKSKVKDEFHEYFNLETYIDNNGDSKYEWHPWLVKNCVYSLESKKRVTQLMQDSNNQYDYCIYIQPDLTIVSPLNTKLFDSIDNKTICVFDYNNGTNAWGNGINDKFAIMKYTNVTPYGCMIDDAKEYRRSIGRLAGEHYMYYIVNKYYTNIKYTDMQTTGKRQD